jgi:hypothetical protein
MVQKFMAIPIGGVAELTTLMRRPAIATGLWIPLGESALLDDPAAERIQRFLGLISLIAFSHPAARRNGRQLSAYPSRPRPAASPLPDTLPLPILTRQDGSYIVMGEVKAELGNLSFVLSPHR